MQAYSWLVFQGQLRGQFGQTSADDHTLGIPILILLWNIPQLSFSLLCPNRIQRYAAFVY